MIMKSEIDRNKQPGGKSTVDVRIKNPQQLFDARDPSPFRDRDLDEDFVEYITSSLKEIPRKANFKLVIHAECTETQELSELSIIEAVRSYFAYKIDLQTKELKNYFKRAQLFLFIGLSVLALCLGLAQSIFLAHKYGVLGVLREGLVIFGWVSLWKPIELLLYDWFPLYEDIGISRRLLKAELEVQFLQKPTSET